jgi:hypothetical protein
VGYVSFQSLSKARITSSTNDEAGHWEVWKWFSSTRFDRIGRYIH